MYKNYTKNSYAPWGYLYHLLPMMHSVFDRINATDKKKWIMRAKLTTFILIMSLMQVSAASFAQKITLAESNVTIEKVIREIRKQTGYDVLVVDSKFDLKRKIQANFNNTPITQVLDQMVKNSEMDYTIDQKTIVIRKKEKSLMDRVVERFQDLDVSGRLINESGQPLAGASVAVKGTGRMVTTNERGEFSLTKINENAVLLITYIGYQTQEIAVNGRNSIAVTLKEATAQLQEVAVVNTGFQTLNKERATGSFTKVDNELLNRRVGATLIERLEGVTSGLMFNGNYVNNANSSPFNIRGLSTVFADSKPLIIVDNFPFDGDLSNINPNDVEDVTVLKDAAAASIWGARSGNGVIVITTKKGKLNSSLNISFNSNLTITDKPDIYYGQNFLESSSFIDAEKFLFDKGYYNSNITNVRKPTLSPIVEILLNQRNGTISETQAKEQMDTYRNYDFRDGLSKHFYQRTAAQQYALNLSGGSDKVSYYFSAGYDDVPSVNVGNSYSRMSLNSNTTFRPIKQLEATVGITHIIGSTKNNNPGNLASISRSTYYPYARIADENGNSLPLPKDYRLTHIQSLASTALLDWQYRPLDELNLSDNTGKSTHTRLNTSLKYSFIPGLNVEARYQLEKQNASTFNLQSEQSYFARNLINLNTQVGTGGALTYGVPLGGILDQSTRDMTSHSIRAQLNLDRKFGTDHEITVIAGVDGKEVVTNVNNWRRYGFKEQIGTATAVNYEMNYPKYGNLGAAGRLPYVDRYNKLTDIYFSYFTNAAYTYKGRYTLSGSARIDQSNLFGVNTNQKSVPLWSIGGAWLASKEGFLESDWINQLKFRATFGYSGNVDKSVSAYSTGYFGSSDELTGAPFVVLQTPPNPELRWERVALWNIGTDFAFFNGTFSGSLEYYNRKGIDMLGYAPLDPTVGMYQIKGNVANIKGSGMDADLTFKAGRNIKWTGNLLFSISRDKVTKYNREVTLVEYMQAAGGELGATSAFTPIVGQPIYGIYSYPWGGLDPINGDPLVKTEGGTNKDYAGLFSSTDLTQLVYHGSARPTHFGAFRNTLAYNGITLSVNLTYKFGYYFRRPTVNYTSLASLWLGHPDYNNRWQKTGDELNTNIPSLTYPQNLNRDNFFTMSEVLVEKGDHIRLQDLRIGYDLPIGKQIGVKNIHLYTYVNNLGVIWKSTKTAIDPDFIANRFVNPKTYAIGIQCNF